MNRKQYWNENYLRYWEAKVKEANADEELIINKHDIKTAADNLIFKYCDLLNINEYNNVLDFGCGFCRVYPYFMNKKVNYWGIDISEAMINEAKKLYPELTDKLIVSEGEKTPFENMYFDNILCFGVFDACYQEDALKEMLRILKINGILILTGKNSLYFEDDEKAFVAERNARSKGHPNYFTNVRNMISQIDKNGYSVEKSFYFLRRGDFQEKKYEEKMPNKFYEYLLIIRKNKNIPISFNKFSDFYSDTFKRKKI